MTDKTADACYEQAVSTRDLLAEVWAAMDAGEYYEGTDPQQYLDEMVLEVVWEVGEPFAVVLGTGGPHVEVTGGGTGQPRYQVDVYWAGEASHVGGSAVTRTGQYFRELYEETGR